MFSGNRPSLNAKKVSCMPKLLRGSQPREGRDRLLRGRTRKRQHCVRTQLRICGGELIAAARVFVVLIGELLGGLEFAVRFFLLAEAV
jgi:hypothetical protein